MRHAIRHARPRRAALLLACALLAAVLALAGCEQSTTTAPIVPPPPASSWTPTATVLVPNTADWATYTDPVYHFRAVIPPGWRLGTYTRASDVGGGDCEHVAVYFPPGDTHQPEPYVRMEMHEFMAIEVALTCSGATTDLPSLKPDRRVTISGATATVYRGTDDDAFGVQRIACVAFGGHGHCFILSGGPPNGPTRADIPLYFGMLSGFRYLGA